MKLEEKLELIRKLYSGNNNFNYFYNPIHKRDNINISTLIDKWNSLYSKNPTHLTHFYVHTPFCMEKCSFCQYHNWIDLKNLDIIEKYLNYLEDYISNFSNILKWKNFWWLSFWWGTPSIYSEKQLDRLLKVIFENVEFNGDFYKEFELHPATTTYKKLDILRKYWIDRISFWIQSFNKKILDSEWRVYCSPERFKELVCYAKVIGFKVINADLILWLNNETKEETLHSFKKMIDCNPTTIMLYVLQGKKETSHLFNWTEDYYDEIKKLYKYLFNNAIKVSDYKVDELDYNIWIELSQKKYNNFEKKCYWPHENTIDSVFSIWFRSYSHIYWEWKYFLNNNDYNVKDINLKFENLTLNDEKNIFLMRFIQEWKINLEFFRVNYNIDIIERYKDVIIYLKKKKKIEIIWSDIIFKTNNISENYLYGLLFFDLKFIIYHSVFIKKNSDNNKKDNYSLDY
jgi:hypothetical protein